MGRRRAYRAISQVDPKALAEFQAGIRKRYSDEDILGQLKSCAARLGRSPTMREFSEDAETTIHPQTVIERFGSWNRAKRAAGLVPRRFATKEELLGCLRELGERIGRTPTAKDVDAHRGLVPSKSLYWHTFGSSDERAPRGRLRRAGRGGAARAGDRAGRGARSRARATTSFCRLVGGPQGRSAPPQRVAGLPHVRRPPGRMVDVSVPRPRPAPRTGDPGRRRTARCATDPAHDRGLCCR